MAKIFDPISSPGGVRDVYYSLAGVLESGEVITGTPTVVAGNSAVLAISAVAINTSAITENGVTVAIGKAVQFRITTASASKSRQKLYVAFVGDGGSADTHELEQPVVPKINQ